VTEAPFTIERVARGRDFELVYRESERELRIWMELAGFSVPYDVVAGIQDLDRWTIPAGEPIPAEHAAVIHARIDEWGRLQRMRIGFVPTISKEEYFAQLERSGSRLERCADGTVIAYPPSKGVLLKRFWNWLWSRE
jgi:hypothetical protein